MWVSTNFLHSSPLFDDFSDDDDFEDTCVSEHQERVGGAREGKRHKHRREIRTSEASETPSLDSDATNNRVNDTVDTNDIPSEYSYDE